MLCSKVNRIRQTAAAEAPISVLHAKQQFATVLRYVLAVVLVTGTVCMVLYGAVLTTTTGSLKGFQNYLLSIIIIFFIYH